MCGQEVGWVANWSDGWLNGYEEGWADKQKD
jgi:hypothetical protein